MAEIILRVKTNTTEAEKGIVSLKSNIIELAKQLSELKINKDLTAQITQLTKYYQSLATAGQTIAKAQSQVQESVNKSTAAVQSAASNVETLRKGYANLVNQLKTLETQYPANTFTDAKKSIESNFKSVQELSKAYQQQSQELLPEQKERLQALSDQYKKLSADVAQYKAENQKIKASETLTPDMGDTLYRLQSQWASLANTIGSISKYYPKGTFDSIMQEITRQSAAVKGLVTEYETNNKMLSSDSVKAIEESQTALLKQKAAFDETRNSATNYHGTLRDLVSGFLKFQLSAVLVMKPLQAMQNAFESINETLINTETVVVSLQRVLDEQIASGEISSELYKTAESLGQTFDNVQEIAQNFAKAGLSWQETLDATKAAVLALNVAELTAEESSEGLIAIMTQFGYEASELTNVIDVLNKAADKSAVDTQELLTALQKTGSYAAAANLSLEDTVSLISALSEATGASGSAMGNALKSLLAYTSKEDSLSTFASLSDEMESVVELYRIGKASILDVWESLSKEMTSLSAEQANALSQWAENSGLETELGSELSDVYDKLTGVYDTAGTYRKNYFIALLNNFDEVQEVMDEISDAQGYTMEEQAKYMDTYEAKLNSLNSKWQELISDENGWLSFKKFWLDVGNDVLTVIDYLGGLKNVAFATSAILLALFGDKLASGAAKFITKLSTLSITAKQNVISLQELNVQITAAKTNMLNAADAETALAAKTELLSLKQERLALVTKSVTSALTAAMIVFTAINAIQGIIDKTQEEAIQKQQELAQAQAEAIAQANESLETKKQESEQITQQIAKIEELRKVYDSLTSTVTERTHAQEELLEIQQSLVENNEEYANSLDLVNGKLESQLELVEKLSEEQLKQQAQQFLNDNFAAVADAQNSVSNSSSLNVILSQDTAYNNGQTIEQVKKLIELAAQKGIDLGSFNDLELPTAYTGPIGYYEELIRNAAQGEKTTVWDWLGFTGIKDIFTQEGWTGSSESGITVSGTIEEQINTLTALKDLLVENYEELGYSYEDAVNYVKQIDEALASVNTEEYKDAQALAEKAQAMQDFINGEITRAEYLEIVYGIEQDINDVYDDQIKKIEYLSDSALEDLINSLNEIKNAEEESLSLEEKKQSVLEAQNNLIKAQQALEDAKKNRSVWKYNAATGGFDWVVDEKAVQEAEQEVTSAEESLQAALEDFSKYLEDQAWDNVIEELESGNATNESIKEILEKWKDIAEQQEGADIAWYTTILQAIKDNAGVDLVSGKDLNGLSASNLINEAVNDPALTAKIFAPTSNEDFSQYLRNNRIIAESPTSNISVPPIVSSALTNTNSTTNDNSITINGVKIGNDMLNKPLIEVLQAVNNLVPYKN